MSSAYFLFSFVFLISKALGSFVVFVFDSANTASIMVSKISAL